MQLLEEAGHGRGGDGARFQFKNGAAFDRNGEFSEFNFVEKTSPVTRSPSRCRAPISTARWAAEAQRQGAEIHFEVEITAVDFSARRPGVTSPRRRRRASSTRAEIRARRVGIRPHPAQTYWDLRPVPRRSPARAAIFTHVRDNTPLGCLRPAEDPRRRASDRVRRLVVADPVRLYAPSVWGVGASIEHHKRRTGTSRGAVLAGILPRRAAAARVLDKAEIVRPPGEIIGYAATVTKLHGPHFALLGQRGRFPRPRCSPRASPSR
jgi:hypothetical protein